LIDGLIDAPAGRLLLTLDCGLWTVLTKAASSFMTQLSSQQLPS